MNNKTTFTKGLVATFILASSTSAWATSFDEQQEKTKQATAIGMGSGVLLGAAIAGPVGAAVAGIVGAFIGKDSAQSDSLDEMAAVISERDAELLALQRAFEQQHAALEMARVTQQQNTMVEASIPTLLSNVQFKTGSVEIAPAFESQLDLIAYALGNNSNLSIQLTGHADQRGDTQFNQALSMQRALSVKQYLENKGVSTDQISVAAVGEEFSQSNAFEETFFDRKVEMEISPAEQLASRKDKSNH